MFWDCPEVSEFWRQVSSTLKDILEMEISCCPRLLLLNDDSSYSLFISEKVTILCNYCC